MAVFGGETWVTAPGSPSLAAAMRDMPRLMRDWPTGNSVNRAVSRQIFGWFEGLTGGVHPSDAPQHLECGHPLRGVNYSCRPADLSVAAHWPQGRLSGSLSGPPGGHSSLPPETELNLGTEAAARSQ